MHWLPLACLLGLLSRTLARPDQSIAKRDDPALHTWALTIWLGGTCDVQTSPSTLLETFVSQPDAFRLIVELSKSSSRASDWTVKLLKVEVDYTAVAEMSDVTPDGIIVDISVSVPYRPIDGHKLWTWFFCCTCKLNLKMLFNPATNEAREIWSDLHLYCKPDVRAASVLECDLKELNNPPTVTPCNLFHKLDISTPNSPQQGVKYELEFYAEGECGGAHGVIGTPEQAHKPATVDVELLPPPDLTQKWGTEFSVLWLEQGTFNIYARAWRGVKFRAVLWLRYIDYDNAAWPLCCQGRLIVEFFINAYTGVIFIGHQAMALFCNPHPLAPTREQGCSPSALASMGQHKSDYACPAEVRIRPRQQNAS
ncbi:uncharacterized protein L969DRAFT_94889 [Mixia osmundae IAM 14324]|uniref:Uncharacterized protein n=1 Tax=Mixia osmundae (strain CBS 9802 / IAM 14324 / JCM 22182 / KY 12970) TaxID=764103 RepID=G7E209_MIXOS|nr:uncharacterized protein L969DRAFT_94889 [Mixia osmundae IAM 14324]KEI38695.1 hypothetical protein L969DRAFT_94889 [Mixia osmundae IAM 14324]GAA96846.1 hypothetical protein E5Q_03519 [Mixia osmundae IAM 14324]